MIEGRDKIKVITKHGGLNSHDGGEYGFSYSLTKISDLEVEGEWIKEYYSTANFSYCRSGSFEFRNCVVCPYYDGSCTDEYEYLTDKEVERLLEDNPYEIIDRKIIVNATGHEYKSNEFGEGCEVCY